MNSFIDLILPFSPEVIKSNKRRSGRTPPMPILTRRERGFLKLFVAMRKPSSRLAKTYMNEITKVRANKMKPVRAGTLQRTRPFMSVIRKSSPYPEDNPENKKIRGMNDLFHAVIPRDPYMINPWHNISINAAPSDNTRIITDGAM
jgi:hypothetical protein